MKVIDLIKNSKKSLFTFELLPPLKGNKIDSIFNAIETLREYEPSYVNITFHQQEVVYIEKPGEQIQKKIVRKRPGTTAIAAAIQNKYNITVVPHLICGGFSKEQTENALIELNFLDINNILVLRGDPAKGTRRFIPEKNGHEYANELVKQIIDLNKGKYLSDDLKYAFPTDFSVGVAGYPEKHYEAANISIDIEFLKQKVETGADYIVTQMFFDNSKFFKFVDLCRESGINVPIIPGIKPVATLNDINMLPQIFSIDLPNDLVKEIKKCTTNKEVRQVGIEWAVMQSKELLRQKAPSIHYYTYGMADNVAQIVKNSY